MRRIARIVLVTLALLIIAAPGAPARAVEPGEMLADPALEARARALSSELRCLVCQNQSIDDSNAPLAKDLRLLVRERLQAGDSDTAVKRYLVARYGDFVLLRPPFAFYTLLLWLAPLLVLIGAVFVALRSFGRRGMAAAAVPPPLSDEERRRLARVLGKSGDEV